MYGGVIISLRLFRNHSAMWLTTLNLLGSACCIGSCIALVNGPAYFAQWVAGPSYRQLGFLFLFGAVQLALPYMLFARGLKHVRPQEAGMIVLIEPLLNPLWVYLISPETDTPPLTTWLGGGLIVAALAQHYLFRQTTPKPGDPAMPEVMD